MMRSLAASKPGGRLLELGTGTGLSTAWLLDGMDAGSRLLTTDNDPSCLAVAEKHLGSECGRRPRANCCARSWGTPMP
jgi:predicted O-methyltransferase YrrM